MLSTPASRVTFGDWLYFSLSALSLAMGIALLFSPHGKRAGLNCAALMGPATLLFGSIIARKYRRQRFNSQLVSVPPGTKLCMPAGRLLVYALMLAIPGVSVLFIDESAGWPGIVLGGMLLTVAALLVGLVLSGMASRTFLRFDVAGLTVGLPSYEFLVPWDNIARVVELELARNEFVGIVIGDTSNLVVTPEAGRARMNKRISNNLGVYGCHLAFGTMHFGVDSGPLATALRRYATDADARRELLPLPALGARP